MKPRNFFHPHCPCTCPRCLLNHPWVLDIAQAHSQAVWLARENSLGIFSTEYIAQRAPGCVRVSSLQLRVAAITNNGVVQFQCIRAYIRNARELLKVGGKYTERLPSDAQLTAHELAGAILLGFLHGFWCDTHTFIEG